MEIIKEYNNNLTLNQTESKQDVKNNHIESNKKFKIVDYFDHIYSYPPKIKIKWDSLDELKHDYFTSSYKSKSNFVSYDAPIIDFIEDRDFAITKEEALSKNYNVSQYYEGLLNKINSSNFFIKKTKEIQSALVKIPVYGIFNGNGEIILNKPSNILGPQTFTNFLNGKLYDYCGGFDSITEKKSELGFFFMNYSDAEKYLKEVARADFEGTNTVGLSIHCISLDSAYKITREYHPGIDFRFVPDFNEVKELLLKSIGKSNLIIEDQQQQLRLRPRNRNLFPYLKKLGNYLSPQFSLTQRNEYFKGVPIYIVQTLDKPKNLITGQYFNIVRKLDGTLSRILQPLNGFTGFGNNKITEGSIKDQTFKNFNKLENYIFFEKKQALEFCEKNNKRISNYSGASINNLGYIVRKPKIFVYNLEDFLEDWEETISENLNGHKNNAQNIFKAKATYFVSPSTGSSENNIFLKANNGGLLNTISQSLNVKIRIFTRAVGVFFSL